MSVSTQQKSDTQEVLRSVEAGLLQSTAGAAVEWCGRAATALYWAYAMARNAVFGNNQQAEVILPAISCATPASAALLAGVTPRFADVDFNTGLPTLESVQARWSPRTCAVLFIHLFGQTADLRPLAEWCRYKNILLIEDLAQALGARLPSGAPVGSIGDMCVYSFNPTKILECGGGALVIRKSELLSSWESVHELDSQDPEIEEETAKLLALSYRNLHHSLVALLRLRAAHEISSAFLTLQPGFRGLYLRRMSDPGALAAAWPRLKGVLNHRHRNASEYDEALRHGPWRVLGGWRQSGVCWRYSLLMNFPDRLVAFSDAVRNDGFHVSNLYWPVSDFFRPADVCPSAEKFARRIVNLWVNESVDIDWVQRCATSVRNRAIQFGS